MNVTYKSNTRDYFENLVEEVTEVVMDYGEVAEKAAKSYAPKDTGKLAESIESETEANEDEILLTISANVPYAMTQEIGSSKTPGKHYLKRGILKTAKTLKEEFKQ